MNNSFSLTKLQIIGASKSPAEVQFKPGLNVICGASNTGKSYIQECIDFMFGGQTLPKDIPQSHGYQNVVLGLKRDTGNEFTLVRSLKGGAFNLFDGSPDRINEKTSYTKLSSKHSSKNSDNLSHFLLSQIALQDKRIRADKYGKTNSLSFRDIAFLTLVSENKIISAGSPLFSENPITRTPEESVFELLLSGTDSSSLIREEKPTERKMRINAQLSLVDELIKGKEKEFQKLDKPTQEIGIYLAKLDENIKEGTKAVTTLQKTIDALDAERNEHRNTVAKIEGRLEFIANLSGRFSLLAEHYKSDRLRLEATLEGKTLFAGLPGNICGKCGQIIPNEPNDRMPKNLETLQAACESELKKVAVLEADLKKTLETLSSENSVLQSKQAEIKAKHLQISNQIEEALKPKAGSRENLLYQNIQERAKIIHLQELLEEISELKAKQASLKVSLNEKKQPGVALKKLGVSDVDEFCEVVQGLLTDWKYQNLGRVVWDNTQKDFVIGRQSRASLGKGYRALTHAAFSIGLMKFCAEKGLPHTGIVLLDTPLNPLREADDPAGKISNEMKNAFYRALAKNSFGGQIIVLENYEPPKELQEKINYQHFTGKKGADRYGFFPLA